MPIRTHFATTRIVGSLLVCLLIAGVLLFGSSTQEQITVYSKAANYSLPIVKENGHPYVGLMELLEPLGSVNTRTDKQRWKLRFDGADAEFSVKSKRSRVRGRNFELSGDFIMQNGRGLVPLASLPTLLGRLLGGPVTFHEDSRRLFVGDVAMHFTAQISQAAPATLTMKFTGPVNPTISTEPGKLHLVFMHEPIVSPGSRTLTFGNSTISSATYQETNGTAEITVTTTVPLFARFADDGRTINLVPAPSQPVQAAQLSPPVQPAQQGQISSATTAGPTSTAPTVAQRFFAVVDPSHGGDERGAALSNALAEKDITLAFARRLQQELSARGLPTLLLRNADVGLSFDQRANTVNAIRPAIYICIHATSETSGGVRMYTALVPPVADAHGPFVNWDSAQSLFLPASKAAEMKITGELQKQQVPVRTLIAPLRPLNNIMAPAVALEIAPPGNDVSSLTSTAYQGLVAGSVAAGIVDARDQLGAGR